MAKRARKYDVYLPLEYNEDEEGNRQQIEVEKLREIQAQLVMQFGGKTASFFDAPFTGSWVDISSEKLYDDKIQIVTVLDAHEDWFPGEEFMRHLKETLKADLQQEEILLIAQDVRANLAPRPHSEALLNPTKRSHRSPE